MAPRLTDRDRMLRTILEKDWSHDVINLALTLGWGGRYHTQRSDRSQRGWPDWALWRPGRGIFVELKTETKPLSTYQVDTIAGMRSAGWEVYVWRPRHLETHVVPVLRGQTIPSEE